MFSYLEHFSAQLPVFAFALLIAIVFMSIDHFVTNKEKASERDVQLDMNDQSLDSITL